jgi:hypothetical protein
MPSITFFPSRDDALLAWSLNFKTLITAAPTTYGLTAPLATAYGTLHTAYATTLSAATDPSTRTKSTVAAKNTARTNLKNNARLLANLVNGTASVTDAQKIELGLNVRATPTPIPPPSNAPAIEVVSVSGWTAKIRLKNTESSGSRGKPVGVLGANVFSHVGATPPSDIGAWKFEGGTGRVTKVDVVFPNTLAAGTTVWLTAFWFNGRKQSGPACAPVSCNLPGGSVSMAA